MVNSPLLHVENLSFSYKQASKSVPVLKDVSFSLTAGECVALIGPSGSGKSTLLHLVGLLEQMQKGNITLAGQKVSKLTDAGCTQLRRDMLGFVYQFHRLLPEFTALENVCLPLVLQGRTWAIARQKAAEILAEVGLEHRTTHFPPALSGGEQQRVAIARAVVHRPKLILADEPTGNLDPKTSDQVFALFMQLARTHQVTALIATHNMGLAKRMDRAISL